MTTIALTGYARSGKDTTGQILVDHHGFTRVAFADKLKALALDLDPILLIDADDPDAEPYRAHLAEFVALEGWEGAKAHPEVRAYLQDLGVAVRNRLGEDAWVNAALSQPDLPEDIVVTDCRFPNEAQAVKARGGLVLRIERPGVRPVNGHVSERPLPSDLVDATVMNDGSLDKLAVNLDLVLRYLNFRPRHMEGIA